MPSRRPRTVFSPGRAGSGYRAPLTPHLARTQADYTDGGLREQGRWPKVLPLGPQSDRTDDVGICIRSVRVLRHFTATVVCMTLAAFAASPGPFVLCASLCPIPGSDKLVRMICWSGSTGSGCSVEGDEESGCCRTQKAECAGCESSESRCPKKSPCSGGNRDQCPMQTGKCFFCLPGRVLADRPYQTEQDTYRSSDHVNPIASTMLALSQGADRDFCSHSPPFVTASISGADRCVAIRVLRI